MTEAEAIVRDLAAGGDPCYYDAYQDRRCALCNATVRATHADEDHDPHCLWLRARALVDRWDAEQERKRALLDRMDQAAQAWGLYDMTPDHVERALKPGGIVGRSTAHPDYGERIVPMAEYARADVEDGHDAHAIGRRRRREVQGLAGGYDTEGQR